MRLQPLLFLSIACAQALSWPPPAPNHLSKRQLLDTNDSQITLSEGIGADGFFYNWFTFKYNYAGMSATPVNAKFTSSANGSFALDWSKLESYARAGKGWRYGSGRNVTYAGDYRPNGNSNFGIYGRSKNPPAEYYILENYGSFNPGSGTIRKGSYVTDGGRYDVGVTQQTPKATLLTGMNSEVTIQQIWAVRQNKRSRGAIDTKAHFEAWKGLGLELDETSGFMVFAVEAYYSSGSASVTVGP